MDTKWKQKIQNNLGEVLRGVRKNKLQKIIIILNFDLFKMKRQWQQNKMGEGVVWEMWLFSKKKFLICFVQNEQNLKKREQKLSIMTS